MANCADVCATLVNDFLYDCNNKSTGGIEQVVKLVNRCDIDISDWDIAVSSETACSHQIAYTGEDPTDLNAVKAQGIPGKRLLNAGFNSVDQDYGTYFTHFVNIFGQGLSEATLCNIRDLANGADVVAFVEQKDKGSDGESAFLVYGFDAGLKLGDITYDSNENNGNTPLPLTTKDDDLEKNPPYVLKMTDYETTKAFFDSL